MSNSSARSFPRYNLEKKNIVMNLDNGEIGELLNVSLGGVGIRSKSSLNTMDEFNIKLAIGKQIFDMNLKLIWEKEILGLGSQKTYQMGCSLRFDNEHQFRTWLLLNQALDKIENKVKV